jgi:AraC-like DNA-binding protein
MGGGKMDLRYYFSEYSSEFLFGLVLSLVVIASNMLAPLIPADIFMGIVSPSMNCFLINFCGCGAWIIYKHNDGIRVRKLVSHCYVIWTVLLTIGLWLRMYYHAFGVAEGLMSITGWEMVFGNIFAWLLLSYPTELLRPRWLNWKRALLQLLPVLIIGAIDEVTDTDLRLLLAFYPMIYVLMLFHHIRAYRQWCEDNFSSMENIDTQWIVQYLVMVLVVGVSYTYMCFNNTPTRTFTQEWLLFFVLFCSTEKVLFRPDPWEAVNVRASQRRKLKVAVRPVEKPLLSKPQETASTDSPKVKEANVIEAISTAKAENEDAITQSSTPKAGNKIEESMIEDDMNEMNEVTNESYAEYRAALEEWMRREKPYLNADFKAQDLREVVPLNRTYMSQFLKAEFGCNFYQYVMRYRIEEAKQMMRENPDLMFQEIAEQCGFTSQTMFGRVFARETGISPTEWKLKGTSEHKIKI